jgi:beta-glucosidase
MYFLTFTTLLLFAGLNPVPGQSGYGEDDGDLQNAPYKDSSLSVEERVEDLLGRMTIQEKASQLMQGDISNWLNTTSGTFNRTGLEQNFEQKAGQFYVGVSAVLGRVYV